MSTSQTIFGWLNNQKVVNNNIVVDEEYLRYLLNFQNNPSDINQVVLSLYNAIIEDETENERRALPPEIEAKISHNNVVAYKLMIENNYSESGFYLDSAYEALDSDTPGRRKIFMRYINSQYLMLLGDYLKDYPATTKMEVINKNADSILTKMVNLLLLRTVSNTSLITHLSQEAITNCVLSIVCHAFVDCKVLENPNN
jgi:hypothetical protein